MDHRATRRSFVAGLGATAFVLGAPSFAAVAGKEGIKFGYTAMTWGEEERKAIDEIAALGFAGIQFRANAVTDFKADELRRLLGENKLTFVALSSGEVSIEEPAADQVAKHLANARFVRDAGGLYLQVLDQLKAYPRSATPEECKKLGSLLNEIGKRTADMGIPLGYHNHLNTLSQMPRNLDLILDSTDPRFVKLELDTAHIVAGGGDPAATILRYRDRLLFLHLKDVVDIPANTPRAKYPFQFVELGQGKVDLPAVFAALRKIRFSGWAVVELDRVPDKARTPKECAQISKSYLQKIGATI